MKAMKTLVIALGLVSASATANPFGVDNLVLSEEAADFRYSVACMRLDLVSGRMTEHRKSMWIRGSALLSRDLVGRNPTASEFQGYRESIAAVEQLTDESLIEELGDDPSESDIKEMALKMYMEGGCAAILDAVEYVESMK